MNVTNLFNFNPIGYFQDFDIHDIANQVRLAVAAVALVILAANALKEELPSLSSFYFPKRELIPIHQAIEDHLRHSEYKKARDLAEKAPYTSSNRIYLARALHGLGDSLGALKVLSLALEQRLLPNDSRGKLFAEKGSIFFSIHEPLEAIAVCEEGLMLKDLSDDTRSLLHEGLAKIYLDLKDYPACFHYALYGLHSKPTLSLQIKLESTVLKLPNQVSSTTVSLMERAATNMTLKKTLRFRVFLKLIGIYREKADFPMLNYALEKVMRIPLLPQKWYETIQEVARGGLVPGALTL